MWLFTFASHPSQKHPRNFKLHGFQSLYLFMFSFSEKVTFGLIRYSSGRSTMQCTSAFEGSGRTQIALKCAQSQQVKCKNKIVSDILHGFLCFHFHRGPNFGTIAIYLMCKINCSSSLLRCCNTTVHNVWKQARSGNVSSCPPYAIARCVLIVQLQQPWAGNTHRLWNMDAGQTPARFPSSLSWT